MLNFRYFCILIFFISSIILFSICDERKLSAHLNPDCPYLTCKNIDGDELKNTTVIHVEADGPSNTLHYIWDLTANHTPSVLVALTELNTNVTIQWDGFLNGTSNSVSFSNKPIYTMTFLFTKIFVFNDAEDRGNFNVTNSSEINDFNTQMLTWVREDFHESAHQVEVTVAGDNKQLFGEGKIKLKLKCFGTTDHDVDFPHLLHSDNVTQVDMEFIKLATNSSFKKPRLASEVVFMVDEAITANQTFKIGKRRTLDDEHTPGIFELIDISSPESYKESRGGYFQYRPVSYTQKERDVSSSTGLHLSQPLRIINPNDELNGTLAWSYYGTSLDKMLVESFNVSFGNPDDEFYTKTQLNTWTFIVGYGAPPDERLSMLVILVAAIGLGIPLLLVVGGVCYLSIKRIRNR